jgi:hypothetical protein
LPLLQDTKIRFIVIPGLVQAYAEKSDYLIALTFSRRIPCWIECQHCKLTQQAAARTGELTPWGGGPAPSNQLDSMKLGRIAGRGEL